MEALQEPQVNSVQNSLSQQSEPEEVDLLDLLVVIGRRRKLIAGVTAASMIAAAIISLVIPNRYTATATLMPPQQTQSTAAMLMSQLGASGLGPLAALAGRDLGLKNPNDLYIGVLRSRTVQEALIRKFGLQKIYEDRKISETRQDLDDASDIRSEKEGLISVSVKDKDSHRAADLANAYVDQLRVLMQNLAFTEASQRRLFFEQQLQQSKNDLGDAEVALEETQRKTGMIQLDSQSKAVIEAIARLHAQIAAKEVQLRAMASFATDQNPDYVRVQQELAGLQGQVEKLEGQQPTSGGDPLLPTAKLPIAGLEYVRRLREVKYREALFEVMAKQFEAAKLDEAKEAAVIQVVDPAVPPDTKSSPRRILIVLLAGTISVLVMSAYAISSNFYEALRNSPEHSSRIAELRACFGHTGGWFSRRTGV